MDLLGGAEEKVVGDWSSVKVAEEENREEIQDELTDEEIRR